MTTIDLAVLANVTGGNGQQAVEALRQFSERGGGGGGGGGSPHPSGTRSRGVETGGNSACPGGCHAPSRPR